MERENISFEHEKEESIDIADIEEAREWIEEEIEHGERPVVTVPKEYEEELKTGLHEHATWIDNVNVITGTLGRDAYNPSSEDRVTVQINYIDSSCVEPRFTGGDHHFHGVVTLRGPIPKEAITFIK